MRQPLRDRVVAPMWPKWEHSLAAGLLAAGISISSWPSGRRSRVVP